MTIKEKILVYLETTGRTKTDFYKSIGAASSNFKGSAKFSALSSDKLAEILTLYPDLSPDWLLNGVGEMLRTPPPHTDSEYVATEDNLLSTINIIRQQAEEIGRLKQRIQDLTHRLEKSAEVANTNHTANAG